MVRVLCFIIIIIIVFFFYSALLMRIKALYILNIETVITVRLYHSNIV